MYYIAYFADSLQMQQSGFADEIKSWAGTEGCARVALSLGGTLAGYALR